MIHEQQRLILVAYDWFRREGFVFSCTVRRFRKKIHIDSTPGHSARARQIQCFVCLCGKMVKAWAVLVTAVATLAHMAYGDPLTQKPVQWHPTTLCGAGQAGTDCQPICPRSRGGSVCEYVERWGLELLAMCPSLIACVCPVFRCCWCVLCSGRGSCSEDGSCVCDTGYVGPACGTTCPGFSGDEVCNGHGSCQYSSEEQVALCVCDTGYVGSGCGLPCPGLHSAGGICNGRGSCHAGDGYSFCTCSSTPTGSDCADDDDDGGDDDGDDGDDDGDDGGTGDAVWIGGGTSLLFLLVATVAIMWARKRARARNRTIAAAAALTPANDVAYGALLDAPTGGAPVGVPPMQSDVPPPYYAPPPSNSNAAAASQYQPQPPRAGGGNRGGGGGGGAVLVPVDHGYGVPPAYAAQGSADPPATAQTARGYY